MATATAPTNIALVKYWGKADEVENLPAVGSLSMTLDGFSTTTSVVEADRDRFSLDGATDPSAAARVFALLDRMAPGRPRLAIESVNKVPTAAGLASSASGFCALVLAAERALGVDLGDERAAWIRRGSGSAARSLFGGFVRLDAEPFAVRPIATELDLRLVVVECARGPKAVSSTEGMRRSASTSDFYAAWVATHRKDLDDATAALTSGDLIALGEVTERSTLKMHATALTAQPPLWYWTPTTWRVLDLVKALRADGLSAWCTMDAGPHVKILTDAGGAAALKPHLEGVGGVVRVTTCGAGSAPVVT